MLGKLSSTQFKKNQQYKSKKISEGIKQEKSFYHKLKKRKKLKQLKNNKNMKG